MGMLSCEVWDAMQLTCAFLTLTLQKWLKSQTALLSGHPYSLRRPLYNRPRATGLRRIR